MYKVNSGARGCTNEQSLKCVCPHFLIHISPNHRMSIWVSHYEKVFGTDCPYTSPSFWTGFYHITSTFLDKQCGLQVTGPSWHCSCNHGSQCLTLLESILRWMARKVEVYLVYILSIGGKKHFLGGQLFKAKFDNYVCLFFKQM